MVGCVSSKVERESNAGLVYGAGLGPNITTREWATRQAGRAAPSGQRRGGATVDHAPQRHSARVQSL